MPGTIKVKEVIRRVSALLQDNNPQFARMKETEIVDALNDAQRAIYKYLPAACSRIDAIKLVPGTLQSIETIPAANCKPGGGSTPAVPVIGSLLLDVICNMGSACTAPGKAIRPWTGGRELLDSFDPEWHTKSDTVIANFLFDPRMPRHFHVTPGVHPTTAVWVRMAYVASPLLIPNTGAPGSELYADAGSSTTTISVHDEHVDDLEHYVCARMLMKNAQYTLATGMGAADYVSMFTGSLNAKATVIMGYNANLTRLPFAPAPTGAASLPWTTSCPTSCRRRRAARPSLPCSKPAWRSLNCAARR